MPIHLPSNQSLGEGGTKEENTWERDRSRAENGTYHKTGWQQFVSSTVNILSQHCVYNVKAEHTLPVMFLLDKVISGSESNEMCVVCRCGDRDATGAADVRVTQLIRQHLDLIGAEVVVVPQHMVVRRTTCSLTDNNQPTWACISGTVSINQLINQLINQSIHWSIDPSNDRSINQSIHQWSVNEYSSAPYVISAKLHYMDIGHGYRHVQHHQWTSSQQFYNLYNKFATSQN